MPELDIAAAGSLLGLAVHTGTGFPVGNVTIRNLYPLTFGEFLAAAGKDMMAELLSCGDTEMMRGFSDKLTSFLREYYYVGGMPAAVSEYVVSEDYGAVRRVQNDILQSYRFDMTKHLTGSQIEYVFAVWDSIPKHLSQENKRFVFGHVRPGARAKQLEQGITWLTQAGIAVKVPKSRSTADSAVCLCFTQHVQIVYG